MALGQVTELPDTVQATSRPIKQVLCPGNPPSMGIVRQGIITEDRGLLRRDWKVFRRQAQAHGHLAFANVASEFFQRYAMHASISWRRKQRERPRLINRYGGNR
jgi:hypothetical protein